MSVSIEQMVDDIVRNRSGRRRVAKKRMRITYERVGLARKLTLMEVCDLKAAVAAAIARKESLSRAPAEGTALCADREVGAPFCWNLNCPRCMPA